MTGAEEAFDLVGRPPVKATMMLLASSKISSFKELLVSIVKYLFIGYSLGYLMVYIVYLFKGFP